jgi:hypothetical protein
MIVPANIIVSPYFVTKNVVAVVGFCKQHKPYAVGIFHQICGCLARPIPVAQYVVNLPIDPSCLLLLNKFHRPVPIVHLLGSIPAHKRAPKIRENKPFVVSPFIRF